MVQRELTPKRVERFEPALREMSERLVDRVQPGQPFDVWSVFARPYAARVAATLVGIPEDDADRAAVWAFDLLAGRRPKSGRGAIRDAKGRQSRRRVSS